MREIRNEFYERALLLQTAYLIYGALGIEIPIDDGKVDGETLAEKLKRALAAGTT
ncbi:MAG: hypothetical protein HFI67_11775 [Lachnospiraceae bacterium]|nr:hypothetical protein [Lachnospiraceae bacterium]